MNHTTLTALKQSIAHWERLVSGNRLSNEYIGIYDCALCLKFFDDGCVGCPVYEKTGEPFCDGSSFMQAHNIIYILRLKGLFKQEALDSPEFKAAAQEELDFLRSLLPTEESHDQTRTNPQTS
jgi:hypothetical protein